MSDGRRQINEDELTLFFRLMGQGIWYLQHVEYALASCLTVKGEIKEPRSVDKDQAENILAKHCRNTLGTSIRLAEEMGVLSQKLMMTLYNFKIERDWLVHRSLNENGDDLYTDAGREAILKRLSEFADQAKALQRLIAKELEDYVVEKGVSREWIARQAIDSIRSKAGGNS